MIAKSKNIIVYVDNWIHLPHEKINLTYKHAQFVTCQHI
jgi:hypothetical protein